MNFYKHHIGDYAQATAHLSFVEDAAYSRMLRKYYAEEKPLPADTKAVQRLVAARTKEEREAVETVLQEFFTLQADGWHNKRADAELAGNRELDEDREARAANERERQRRHREERKALFGKLREQGLVPAWDTKTETLRKLYEDAAVTRDRPSQSQPVTPPVTRTATANQTPDTRHQTPEEKTGGEVRTAPAAAVAPSPTRGCRLPKDWRPGPEQRAFAAELGLVNGRFDSELEKFRDYWIAQPGQKGVRTDWTATLRNWLRRAAEDLGKRQGSTGAAIDFEGVH